MVIDPEDLTVTASTLTVDDIMHAATDHNVPFLTCWHALGSDGPRRQQAREEIAKVLNASKETP